MLESSAVDAASRLFAAKVSWHRAQAEAEARQVACAEEDEPGEPLTSAAGVRRSAEALHARS